MMKIPEIVHPDVASGSELCFVNCDETLVPDTLVKHNSVCFSALSYSKKDLYHIGIPDNTSHLFGDTQYSIEYINDTLEFFSDICPHVVYNPDFQKNKYHMAVTSSLTGKTFPLDLGVLFISFRRSEVNGSLILGFLNSLKAMAEFPFVPLNYCLLKRMYPRLNYYQLLVLSCCCTTQRYKIHHKNNYGNHEPFYQIRLNTIKGIDKPTLIAAWNRHLVFDSNSTLDKRQSFSTSGKNSNGIMLLPPWGYDQYQYITRHAKVGTPFVLYLEEAEYYLNDDADKPLLKRT